MTKRKLQNQILKAIKQVIDTEGKVLPIIDILDTLKKFNLTIRCQAKRKRG